MGWTVLAFGLGCFLLGGDAYGMMQGIKSGGVAWASLISDIGMCSIFGVLVLLNTSRKKGD